MVVSGHPTVFKRAKERILQKVYGYLKRTTLSSQKAHQKSLMPTLAFKERSYTICYEKEVLSEHSSVVLQRIFASKTALWEHCISDFLPSFWKMGSKRYLKAPRPCRCCKTKVPYFAKKRI